MLPYGITVQVVDVEENALGDIVETVRGSIDGCAFAPSTSTEDNDNREQVDTYATVYAPDTAVAVKAQDKVRVNGVLWRVEGDPNQWASPFTGWKPGRVIRVRQVRG